MSIGHIVTVWPVFGEPKCDQSVLMRQRGKPSSSIDIHPVSMYNDAVNVAYHRVMVHEGIIAHHG